MEPHPGPPIGQLGLELEPSRPLALPVIRHRFRGPADFTEQVKHIVLLHPARMCLAVGVKSAFELPVQRHQPLGHALGVDPHVAGRAGACADVLIPDVKPREPRHGRIASLADGRPDAHGLDLAHLFASVHDVGPVVARGQLDDVEGQQHGGLSLQGLPVAAAIEDRPGIERFFEPLGGQHLAAR